MSKRETNEDSAQAKKAKLEEDQEEGLPSEEEITEFFANDPILNLIRIRYLVAIAIISAMNERYSDLNLLPDFPEICEMLNYQLVTQKECAANGKEFTYEIENAQIDAQSISVSDLMGAKLSTDEEKEEAAKLALESVEKLLRFCSKDFDLVIKSLITPCSGIGENLEDGVSVIKFSESDAALSKMFVEFSEKESSKFLAKKLKSDKKDPVKKDPYQVAAEIRQKKENPQSSPLATQQGFGLLQTFSGEKPNSRG